MTDALEQAGLEAVDRFITTWNSRDPIAWADSLHYPHARPTYQGPINIAPDADTYASNVDFDKTIATGWDHSEWDYKHVLHVSPRKIHVAGQWSRYNSDGNVILTAPIVYICTLIDGKWGIQCRFGADFVDEDTDTTGIMTRALNLVQDYVNHHNAGNRDAAVELLNFPHFNIGIGDLGVSDSASDFELPDYNIRIDSLIALQTGQHSVNAGIEVGVSDSSGTRQLQGVLHINNRDGHLGMQAWSFLDPSEPVEE